MQGTEHLEDEPLVEAGSGGFGINITTQCTVIYKHLNGKSITLSDKPNIYNNQLYPK